MNNILLLMKNIISLSRIGQQVRQRSLQFRRKYGGGDGQGEGGTGPHTENGHRYSNPGPPITLDYMPIPFQPYKQVHAELNRKFNMYLLISGTFFTISAYYCIFVADYFNIDANFYVKSYRNRKAENKRMDAERAAAAAANQE